MKTKFLSHAIWALVAIATFLLGSERASNDRDRANGAERGRRGWSTRAGKNEAGEELAGRRTVSRRSGARSPRGADDGFSLTEEQIAELGKAFKEGNLVERRLAFAELLKKLTPENALQVREQIAHLPENAPEFREFHYAWGAVAGNDAVKHGKDTPKKDMAAALAGWASADPTAALGYFDSLPPAEQDSAALMKWGAAFGLADADPQLAVEFARQRMREGDKDASKMVHLATAAALRTGDREEATQWAGRIPEGELQNTAYQHLAGEFAKEDPAGAVAWADTLPDGEGKDHAVGTSFHHWANRNPEEAAQALASLPPSQKDAATFGYATSVVHKEPAVGVQWAATIGDAESRNRALVDTGRVFYKRDREAALEWLSSGDLPEAAVRKITGEE